MQLALDHSAVEHDVSHVNKSDVSPDPLSSDAMSRMEQDINDLIGALALLGIGRCSQCRRFIQRSDPGALFDCNYGKSICYGCIPDWWSSVSTQVSVSKREEIEAKLAPWLRKYHHAQVVKDGPGALDIHEGSLQIVTSCIECRGSGKILEGERCRFCNGFGTVRIVVPN